jgi:hypothetical protein
MGNAVYYLGENFAYPWDGQDIRRSIECVGGRLDPQVLDFVKEGLVADLE